LFCFILVHDFIEIKCKVNLQFCAKRCKKTEFPEAPGADNTRPRPCGGVVAWPWHGSIHPTTTTTPKLFSEFQIEHETKLESMYFKAFSVWGAFVQFF
jgi:hypothetical protein